MSLLVPVSSVGKRHRTKHLAERYHDAAAQRHDYPMPQQRLYHRRPWQQWWRPPALIPEPSQSYMQVHDGHQRLDGLLTGSPVALEPLSYPPDSPSQLIQCLLRH